MTKPNDDSGQLKQAFERWEQELPVEQQLPEFRLDNGCRVCEVSMDCIQCRKPLVNNDIHGKVTQPIPSLINLDMIGYCRHCNLLIPAITRTRAVGKTMQREWLDSDRGWMKNVMRKAKEPSALVRFAKWMGWLK